MRRRFGAIGLAAAAIMTLASGCRHEPDTCSDESIARVQKYLDEVRTPIGTLPIENDPARCDDSIYSVSASRYFAVFKPGKSDASTVAELAAQLAGHAWIRRNERHPRDPNEQNFYRDSGERLWATVAIYERGTVDVRFSNGEDP